MPRQDTTKRTCGNCGIDRTPHNEGIFEVRDFRGNTFALIGNCCADEIKALLDKLFVKYGGHIENGATVASPRGTPTIRSIEHLRLVVGLDYSATAEGYMLTYKGQNIGGASILGKYHGNRRMKQIQDHAQTARLQIEHLIAGQGEKRFRDAIAKINN